MDERGTQSRLLEAATGAFVEHGYRDAVVRDICSRAGVNVAAVNYHFGGKEELYRAVLHSAYERVTTRPMPRLADAPDDPEACLEAFIAWNVERLMGREAQEVFGVLMSRELLEPSPAFRELIQSSMMNTWGGLTEIVGAVLERPADDRTVQFLSMSVFGQCLIYKHCRPVLDHVWPDFAKAPPVDAITDHVTVFSLAGVRAFHGENGATS